MLNPFDVPKRYRQLMLDNKLLNFQKKSHTGKSLACIFLTRFCSTGCPFCFYKSAPAWRKRNIEDQFSDEGITKFIEFANSANLGYLLVSGGGEPLNQRKHILQIVEEVEADRIVLVTSANWGRNHRAAKRYVDDIYQAMTNRRSKTTVVIRVSVSEGHSSKIGIDPAINLIKIFAEHYPDKENFLLQIKTFDNDKTFEEVLEQFPQHTRLDTQQLVSDNPVLIKKIPSRYEIAIDKLQFVVGVSKIFYSGLQPNLNHPERIKDHMHVFDTDLEHSEDDNPAIVFNPGQEPGIDWSINYNGDICTWQNQVRDNYMNLYEDDYQTILSATLNDPITYSFIDKGSRYRDKIVSEVDRLAVIRTKGIGLRDTSGTIIFEEERTRLYYAIRVLQDYIAEGKITQAHMCQWPREIVNLVSTSIELLQKLFNSSTYTIVKQQQDKPFSATEWKDLFHLIKLGHYQLSKEEIQSAMAYYRDRAKSFLLSLNDVTVETRDLERRLTERLMHIKPLKRFAYNHSDTEEAVCA